MAASPLEKSAPALELTANSARPFAAPPEAARPPLRIGPADQGRVMTLQEFFDAEEEEGYRYELARGVLEVTLVPNEPHGQVVFNLYNAFALYHRQHPGVIQRFGGASEFRLWLPGMVSGRNPDVAVVLRGAPRDFLGRRLPGLAVEVVSKRGEARDYEVKRQEYLAYGLIEYWIVDPLQRRVMVLSRHGDIWAEQIFEGDQTIESLVLPGIDTRVVDLWVDQDEEVLDHEPPEE